MSGVIGCVLSGFGIEAGHGSNSCMFGGLVGVSRITATGGHGGTRRVGGTVHLSKFGSVFTITSVSTTGLCCRRFGGRVTLHPRARQLGITAVCDFNIGRSCSSNNTKSRGPSSADRLSRDSESFLRSTVTSCGRVFNATCSASDRGFRGCCGRISLHVGGHRVSVLVIIGVFLANFSTAALGAL